MWKKDPLIKEKQRNGGGGWEDNIKGIILNYDGWNILYIWVLSSNQHLFSKWKIVCIYCFITNTNVW